MNIPAPSSFKKLPTWLQWVLIIIFIIFTSGSGWFIRPKLEPIVVKIFNNKPDNVLSNKDENPLNTQVEEEPQPCTEVVFSEPQHNKWETNGQLRSIKDAWYPKKGFPAPVMWYQEPIIPTFRKFTLAYQIKSDDDQKFQSPSLILYLGRQSEGKKQPVLQLWMPEGENLQLIRVASSIEATRSVNLSDPVKVGQTDQISIEPTYTNGNTIGFNITPYYISRLSNRGIDSDVVPLAVDFGISDVKSSKELVFFGIGTYFGHGIKPISYKVCE